MHNISLILCICFNVNYIPSNSYKKFTTITKLTDVLMYIFQDYLYTVVYNRYFRFGYRRFYLLIEKNY